MNSITVTNLSKAYKHFPNRWHRLAEWFLPNAGKKHHLRWVLRDVNFTVGPGEAVGVMGVNGAGKSTLLKMICGTTQPTAGQVQMHGRVAALLELGMGFHPDFTGRQNILMSGQLLGYGTEHLVDLMPDIEAFAEIGDYIDQPVRVYSSGMQVRLAFSVATAIRPDILIVDEALAVGDAYFQAKCFKRISQFKNEGTTLLLVSHSPTDIVKHCERAILLKEGRMAMDGTARAVSNRYLDELFGKREKQEIKEFQDGSPIEPQAGSSSQIEKNLLESGSDLYHTRPGYRKEEHRWGQGGAVIVDYLISSDGAHYPARIESNATTRFVFKVRFDGAFDNVVPGFLIKTLEGIFLYGTNSLLSGKDSGEISVKKGETRLFVFVMPVSLNEGHYLLSFGISSENPGSELVPLDRRYDSILIHVGRYTQFWGITDLNAKFETISPHAEGN